MPRLLFAGKERVQSRFPSIRGVTVNDSSFGRLIERRDESANLFRVQFIAAAHALLQRAQPRPRAAVSDRAGQGLTGTFRC